MAKKFTEVTPQQLKNTLARRFVPLADSLRDSLTKFGLRVYNVRIVRVKWSGGERGVGVPELVKTTPILPTPQISDLNGLQDIVQLIGREESGSITVSQISGRYTEEELRGLEADGTGIGPDEEVFWEVEFPRPDGAPAIRRRFLPSSAPVYKPGALQWLIQLERSSEDRARNGDPE